MAIWGKKDKPEVLELPPEYDALKPEDIVAKLKAADLAQTQIADLQTKVSELDSTKQKVAELENRIRNAAPPQNPPNPNNPPERTSFLVDEEKAFNERVAPLATYTLGIAEQLARNSLSTNINDPVERKMFQKWGKEVDEIMKQEQNPTVKANPQAWSAAWDIIKGRHVTEITKAAQDRSDFFAETATGDMGAGPDRGPKLDQLTDEDKKVASKYGIKEEDYLAQKKNMVVYHG